MATKAELEWQCNTFNTISSQAELAYTEGKLTVSIDFALQSLQFIDGMIQFEKRFKKSEVIQQPTLKLILVNAPIIFRFQAINDVEEFLNRTKRVEKNSSIDWRKMIEEARRLLDSALHLWQLIETESDINCVDRIGRVYLLNAWERMGVVTHQLQGYSITSAMNARYRAKCFGCGQVFDSNKDSLLSEMSCPVCKTMQYFVILGPVHRKGA